MCTLTVAVRAQTRTRPPSAPRRSIGARHQTTVSAARDELQPGIARRLPVARPRRSTSRSGPRRRADSRPRRGTARPTDRGRAAGERDASPRPRGLVQEAPRWPAGPRRRTPGTPARRAAACRRPRPAARAECRPGRRRPRGRRGSPVPCGSSSSGWRRPARRGRRDVRPASGWSVRDDQDVVLVEQRLDATSGWLDRQVDHGQVEPAAGQLGHERGGGGVDQRRPGPWGRRRSIARSSSGVSQRPVVPMMPMRTDPEISPIDEATSAVSASSSAWMRRARATTSSPASVSMPVVRSTRRRAQLPLEVGDVGGDVRLHGVQGPGGGGEAVVVGHGGQGGELAEVHRCNMMARIRKNCWTDWARFGAS